MPLISCGTTGLLAVLLVNGAYFQIFMAMFNISVLRCARHCPSAALHTPPTAVGSTFICSFILCGIFHGLHCFACCSGLLGSCSSGLICGVLISGGRPVSRISTDNCFACGHCCYKPLLDGVACFRILGPRLLQWRACTMHKLLYVMCCARLLTCFEHRHEFVPSGAAYCC